MLTRLKVSGFKNLVDVDVRFGPFTCVAGANGVGKSNLFDAVRFLSALADQPLAEAALSVRGEGGRAADVRNLFHRVRDCFDDRMRFEVEMIVPREGIDDLGQAAQATITFLRYILEVAFRAEGNGNTTGSLEIVREELSHIKIGDAPTELLFSHSMDWRASAISGRRTTPFISTETAGGKTIIKLHQDGKGGLPKTRSATTLPRTFLSTANAAESPTALLARREMQSWRLLQLEPSALREPDDFKAPSRLAMNGAHLPATLHRLAQNHQGGDSTIGQSPAYGQVTVRLSQLLDGIQDVQVVRDEKRELLTLVLIGNDGTPLSARSLSDGTLRFLALAVLEVDPKEHGLLCLEEPENGIPPERVPAMIGLLQELACDVQEPVSEDNPLRQVIVNTHSPSVVAQVPDDCLLVAETKEAVRGNLRFMHAAFSCLPGTWRTKEPKTLIVPKGRMLVYLNPLAQGRCLEPLAAPRSKARKVMENPAILPLLQRLQTAP